MDALAGLNDQQRRAVNTSGNLMIIAGPGTGKTKTLVAKIQYLIEHDHVNPDKILAITFTKKTARELSERISASLNLDAHNSPSFVATFHACAYEILKTFDPEISQFSLAEHTQQIEIINQLKTDASFEHILTGLKHKDILSFLSQIKNSFEIAPQETQLIEAYNALLTNRHLIDYDDILLKTHKLLQVPEICERVQARWTHILVDEYQDTNDIQYKLLVSLASKARHVCVVGDPLQSIYGFRGARADIYTVFKKDFSVVQEITLDINYRSATNIIDTSHGLFPGSRHLIPAQKIPGHVEIIRTLNEFTEAEYIISHITSVMGGFDLNQSGAIETDRHQLIGFSDIAVVFRTRELARTLEKKFRESGIPYQLVGAKTLFEYAEIKLLISKARDQLYTRDKTKLVSAFFAELIETLQFKELFKESDAKLNRIQEFQNFIVQFNSTGLDSLIHHIDNLVAHGFYDASSDKVTLLTMHAAKGLEFKHVFICGFEDGVIPYTKKFTDPNQIEEEKRLLYVAMTRAKEQLYLLYASNRYRQTQLPSRFCELIKTHIQQSIDPAIEEMRKKTELRRKKKNQLALF